MTVAGFSCHTGYCSGDTAGNCGNDIAEPTLACADYVTCAPLAAAACSGTSGCVSFALSAAWGFGKAKLFSAGSGGLTPNDQWTTWVSNGHGHSKDVKARDRDRLSRGSDGGSGAIADHAQQDGIGGNCTLLMATSNSTWGPWVPFNNATISPCGSNNPGPFVHPNGTVFIVFTDQDMGLWSAPTWRGPYTLVTSGACGGGEDPSLYIDAAGHFHCLYHASPFSIPDIAIGHAFSEDGFTWFESSLPAANSSILYVGLGVVVHGKRERPHLYSDAVTGVIEAFVSAVCINPACDPFSGAPIDPSFDCSSGTQYHRCDANSPGPGYFDRTYTLTQRVNTAGTGGGTGSGFKWFS